MDLLDFSFPSVIWSTLPNDTGTFFPSCITPFLPFFIVRPLPPTKNSLSKSADENRMDENRWELELAPVLQDQLLLLEKITTERMQNNSKEGKERKTG